MPKLEVPNAVLNYETTGSGPALLLIPGANGEQSMYKRLAAELAGEYTVITYDRRGFSESLLTGPQDYAHRLQTDADDAAALIKEVGKGQPGYVFGSSSGAIVSMQLLRSHPDQIKALVAHEPPTLKVLPDADELINFYRDVYKLYREQGLVTAQIKFASNGLSAVDRAAMSQGGGNRGGFGQANATYWMERELPVYPEVDFDDDTMRHVKGKLIMGVGTQSEGSFAQRSAEAWSEKLGVPLAPFTGGHVGYAMNPAENAQDMRNAFKGR